LEGDFREDKEIFIVGAEYTAGSLKGGIWREEVGTDVAGRLKVEPAGAH